MAALQRSTDAAMGGGLLSQPQPHRPPVRRLTKMYTDTKKSYDDVTKPISATTTSNNGKAETAESTLLQRKLRIQKARLITWGLDWSDTSAAAQGTGDIDESLEREGLADVVESILCSIKEIVQAAELMRYPERDVGYGLDSKGSGEKKRIQQEKPNFVDLVHDLTTSIDTLYDLSRSRRALRGTPATGPSLEAKQSQFFSQFHMDSDKAKDAFSYSMSRDVSSRVEPSLLIDATSVIIPEYCQPPSYESLLSSEAPLSPPPALKTDNTRTMGHLRLPRSSANPWKKDGGQGTAPVLIEYAPFDPIYSDTGVPPPLSHLESLAQSLHRSQDGSRSPNFRVLNLIGYFEDPQGARYGLVYDLPPQVLIRQPSYVENLEILKPTSLLTVMEESVAGGAAKMPSLEDRFRLALHVALTVFSLHAKGIKHRDMRSANIILFPDMSTEDVPPQHRKPVYDLRNPYLASFDVFSECNIETSKDSHNFNIYRHPNDPLISKADSNRSNSPSFDIYGLGMILLEIGLWIPLKTFLKEKYTLTMFKERIENVYVRKLPFKCGSLYMKAVQACLQTPDLEISGQARGTIPDMSFYWSVVKRLERCCAIEGPDPVPSNLQYDSQATQQSRSSMSGPAATPFKRRESGVLENIPLDVAVPEPLHVRHSTEVKSPPQIEEPIDDPLDIRAYSRIEPRPDHPAVPEADVAPVPVYTGPGRTNPNIPEPAPKPRLKVHPVKCTAAQLDDWHRSILPRLERILEKTLVDERETVTIDLIGVGETQHSARPTIFVTCSSVGKVKGVLTRRFKYDKATFDLKVRKGKVRRSTARRRRPRPALPGRAALTRDDMEDIPAKNPFYQSRPLCGASIGAYKDYNHLPPATFGGVVLVDKKPLAMTVHHLLDTPSDGEYSDEDEDNHRSSARWHANYQMPTMDEGAPTDYSYNLQQYHFDISDDEDGEDDAGSFDPGDSEGYESDDFSDADAEADFSPPPEVDPDAPEHGDVPGVGPEEAGEITITQPAIDDVDEDFFPNEDDKDDEHLDSHTLGHVHASSGVRRWQRDGVKHEIDWALLSINDDRLQPYNLVQGGKRFCPAYEPEVVPQLKEPVCRQPEFVPEEDLYPTRVAPMQDLSDMRVHCFGRTSGLQGGIISSAMSSVKIYGRTSYSRSYHVVGGFGVGGDSGAWIIDNEKGRVCGHVLAWCSKNNIAYFCPMEVLLEDIRRSLPATTVELPGAVEVEIQTSVEDKTPTTIITTAAIDDSAIDEGLEMDLANLSLEPLPVENILETGIANLTLDPPARTLTPIPVVVAAAEPAPAPTFPVNEESFSFITSLDFEEPPHPNPNPTPAPQEPASSSSSITHPTPLLTPSQRASLHVVEDHEPKTPPTDEIDDFGPITHRTSSHPPGTPNPSSSHDLLESPEADMILAPHPLSLPVAPSRPPPPVPRRSGSSRSQTPVPVAKAAVMAAAVGGASAPSVGLAAAVLRSGVEFEQQGGRSVMV